MAKFGCLKLAISIDFYSVDYPRYNGLFKILLAITFYFRVHKSTQKGT
ncbi:hypothetical protein [Streptococcus uberis]